ncbi:aromatic-ring-hydroxylating dioxygenase subunit beta [Mycobacterium hodleri]|uniref:Aromatic-ring-hydroxylating dioxygenase subunit beta n=2 Tax=Mycolicibacterium hodleri TaxID=49897 RepID=A0A502EFK6_9MYCO|nr:aromatic-ring-hydroxylating dioxygenase subunit beta [Mycolicibacterium hodleri]
MIPTINTSSTITRAIVEEFLYAEAEMLDTWRLDEWLELFAADAKYEVPCNDALDGDPSRDMMLIDDDLTRLKARVTRLNSRRAHREYPHSRTNHQIFNVRIDSDPRAEVTAEIVVAASFTVWRFRGGVTRCYVGQYHYKLRSSETGLRIARKRINLDMTDLRSVSDVAIIL